jgi:hypothetical protein
MSGVWMSAPADIPDAGGRIQHYFQNSVLPKLRASGYHK